jgi:hypothetical protein
MTNTEILTAVNQITRRAETSIDDYLIQSAQEISRRKACLAEEATGNTVANVSYIDKPADLVILNNVVIDGVSYDPITFDEYLNDILNGVCLRGDYIYIRPTPATVAAYTVYYRKEHPASATILLPDIFKQGIIHYVAARVYQKYEINDKGDEQLKFYEYELAKANLPEIPLVCKPRKTNCRI